MGLSGSSTTTSNAPSPQAIAAGNSFQNVYNQQAPRIQALADQVGNLIPGMVSKYQQGNPAVNAAQGYITNLLGSNMQSNPYLDQIIGRAGEDVGHAVGASMGTRGNFGGSVMAKMIADRTARASLDTRYQDYAQQQALRAQAAGMAPSIAAADTIQIAPLLSATQLAGGMPMQAASQYAQGMGGLFGNAGQQKTTENPSALSTIGQIASIGAAIFSDERLKTDIKRVGETAGGLPVYDFRYLWDDQVYRGVMAQDVARMQPEALGPMVDGYMTVNYGEVR